jgi:hypothetical protein
MRLSMFPRFSSLAHNGPSFLVHTHALPCRAVLCCAPLLVSCVNMCFCEGYGTACTFSVEEPIAEALKALSLERPCYVAFFAYKGPCAATCTCISISVTDYHLMIDKGEGKTSDASASASASDVEIVGEKKKESEKDKANNSGESDKAAAVVPVDEIQLEIESEAKTQQQGADGDKKTSDGEPKEEEAKALTVKTKKGYKGAINSVDDVHKYGVLAEVHHMQPHSAGHIIVRIHSHSFAMISFPCFPL